MLGVCMAALQNHADSVEVQDSHCIGLMNITDELSGDALAAVLILSPWTGHAREPAVHPRYPYLIVPAYRMVPYTSRQRADMTRRQPTRSNARCSAAARSGAQWRPQPPEASVKRKARTIRLTASS